MEIEEFELNLQKCIKQKVNLFVTNNRRIVFSFNKNNNEIKVKINRIFLNSPPELIKTIAEFILTRSNKSKVEIKKFISSNQEEINKLKPVKKRQTLLIHQGINFNIKHLFDEINRKYFFNEIDAFISWGKHPRKVRRKKSIRYGAFMQEKNLIIINRILDNDFVRKFFLEYIVYHEMLHAYFFKLRSEKKNDLSYKQLQIEFNNVKNERIKSHIIHDREFKIKEREFADYERAKKWGKDNLKRMLKI